MSKSLSVLPESAKRAALAVHPDDKRYKCRFDIRSESGNRIYRISFDSAPGAMYWKCSCPGCIAHGHCKHLRAMGLPGRKQGKSLEWARKLKLAGK
jgi:hypothetical protein